MAKNDLRIGNFGLMSKVSAEATGGYVPPKSATADNVTGNNSPTIGKSIPIITGGARPQGEVIWLNSRIDKDGICRGDIAVCFGRNEFDRSLYLSALVQNGVPIYIRKNGIVKDPPNTIRFYDGTQTDPDPLIVSVEGADKTPAWTGYIYAVMEDVALGDGTNNYAAEFTDDANETSHSALGCDATLADIELKYNPHTGLFYGLEFPGTDHANIITSDGCQVLRRTQIYIPVYPVDFDCIPIVYSLTVVKCSSFISVDGYITYPGLGGTPTDNPPIQWVVNPDTGRIAAGLEWVTARNSNTWNGSGTPPSDTGIEIKEAFIVGGGTPAQFAVLRLFERGATYYEAYWSLTLPIGPESNVSGIVFDMNEPDPGRIAEYNGTGRVLAWHIDETKGGAGPCYDVALISREVPVAPLFFPDYGTYTAVGWWVDQAPFLDDFIFLKNEFDRTNLGGVRTVSGDVTWYLMEYSSDGGLVATFTGTIIGISFDWSVSGLNYDEESNEFLISVNPPSGELVSSRIYKIGPFGSSGYIETGGPTNKLLRRGNGVVSGGSAPMSNADGSTLSKIDLATGNVTTLYSGAAPNGDPVVDLSRNLISVPTVSGRTQYTVGQVTKNEVALSSLLTDICALKGYSPSDLSFEGFTGLTVSGMTISSTTSVADLINRIGKLYGFVFAETDGKLKFRRRRSSTGVIVPDLELTDADLVEGVENITVQRQAATTVLGSLGLTWLDPDRDYESNSIVARRIVGVLSGEAGKRDEEISLPIAIDQETARKLLFESFYAMAEGETRVSFSVGPEYLQIEPGDIISLAADGTTRLVQVRRVTHRADVNVLEIEADTFMSQATPDVRSAGGNTGDDPAAAIYGRYVHLDIPLITPNQYPGDGFVRQFHGLTTYDATSWSGADLYVSQSSTLYKKVLDYDAQPLTVALAQDALGPTPQEFAMDETETLTIKVIGGDASDFASVYYAQQMSDDTLCAYGSPGAWELISFQTVTDNLDGTLTLSNLQRGLYGTQKLYFTDDDGGLNLKHAVGDFVVFLDKSKLRSSVWATSEINRSDNYIVATADIGVNKASKELCTMTGTSLRPPPVANVIVEHAAGSGSLVITWDQVSPTPHPWFDTGATGSVPEVYTYSIEVRTFLYGRFYFDVTDGSLSYTWTAYGSTVGGSSVRAEDAIDYVKVTVTSPTWGQTFTTTHTEIREA